jgi:uncharacterized repeat protein (TIGR01451 family)
VSLTLLSLSALPAAGQINIEGRAVGTSAQLLGTDVPPLRTADTGPQTATAPGSFTAEQAGATIPAAPLAEVASSASSTEGEADAATQNNGTFVESIAGDVVARVLPGAAPEGADVIAVATTGTTLTLACDDDQFGTENGILVESGLELLNIAGNPVISEAGPIPQGTVLSIPVELGIVILNEQIVEQVGRGARVTVNAFRAQLVQDAEVLNLTLSSASGGILDVPEDVECDLFPPPPLSNSLKLGELLEDADDDGEAGPGDTLLFTLRAENSGDAALTNVRVVDRVPSEVDVDETSILLDGEAIEATIGPCPTDVNFERCQDEESSECLTATIAELAPGEVREITFEALIEEAAEDDDLGGETCNTAIFGDVERNVIVDLGPIGFDEPPISPDILQTTGSGGCAVRSAGRGSGLDFWPVLMLIGLVSLRRIAVRRAR